MAKNRFIQLFFAVVTGLSINFIGWPGPNGGLQCLYEIFWQSSSHTNSEIQVIRLVLLSLIILGVISAFFNNRCIRLMGTFIGAIGLTIFFIFLLTRMYPPVIPVVMVTAAPFLCGLIGSIWFAFLPKKSAEKIECRMRKSRIIHVVFAVVTGLALNLICVPGSNGGLQCLCNFFWRFSFTSPMFQIIRLVVVVLIVLFIISACLQKRRIRLLGTLIAAIGLAIFFIFLLTQIYPPFLPLAMMSSTPFLCGLIGSVWFAFLPKKSAVTKEPVQSDSNEIVSPEPPSNSCEKRECKQRRPIVLIFLIILLGGGGVLGGLISGLIPISEQRTLLQLQSPDKRSLAVLSYKERHSFSLPLQPYKILERQCRLKVSKDDKSIYDSTYEGLNIYQSSPGFALDLMWSPDSTCLAYRYIGSLRIINRNGEIIKPDITPKDFVITSFRWIDNNTLLILAKKGEYPLDMNGGPYNYQGYIETAKDILITQFNLNAEKTERYRQKVKAPTMLFHSVDFLVEEISPKANRVAFSDGETLCIFDNIAGKLIVKIKIPQKKQTQAELAQLEGVWWQNNDKLVIGVGLLGSPVKTFYTYDIPSTTIVDVTGTLLPIWDGTSARNYIDSDWYRASIK